ncbi:MAG: hypothetical protein Q7I97_06105 [Thermovirgaceae bacterium]|nr:hypothetical protein [Thermovirgaceae bacterium]
MKTVIANFFKSLELGGIEWHEGLAAVPVFSFLESRTPHITLQEAFKTGQIEVRELSQCGSVPELFVINNGTQNILILDGEELQGAKQNRVLNITILIAAQAKVVVPVSCTEKGRWQYTSSVFRDSGTITAQSVRSRKNRSVSENLREGRAFSSDQSEVWSRIDDLAMRSNVRSRTGAMRDVFQDMEKKLETFASALPAHEEQRGVIFFRGGDPAGFEYLSNPLAFRDLYPRILKSFAVEVAAERKPAEEGPTMEQVRIFIEKASSARVSVADSAGRGEDIRFTGAGVIGSALAYDEEILHAVFFPEGKSGGSVHEKGAM